MATVIEGPQEWSTVIRCAHPVCGFGLHRVEGCFSLIRITLADIKHSTDYEGDTTFWVDCPCCGQRLYPEWQIGKGPLNNSMKINRKTK
ncbi:MAG: hypothetical protein UU48_C0003G0013 [Candidatus Uhrbacteria bacterium GW2011_GWF2_41_16]|jgi:hypothetical protein|uniref:Uncharacterized protein n=2 Tax=Candidatus Uhriibacteriota TaxID=1752732 RepID=A0A0G0YDC1_9BACT|nr:MAG: hypothetical protein UU35_C0003G0013 [Candidatus Uhrbacteria bacterium GW2011_GWC2_41_11]KKR98342.1 MAG: hypothetical protein UU48_C0003G0013 [Candidatus Uhrbacteria bacterium GW2011_GWF2_41_16]HBP00065.1 hypothetical protein [Candidatus Uhrbacteria bacterium]